MGPAMREKHPFAIGWHDIGWVIEVLHCHSLPDELRVKTSHVCFLGSEVKSTFCFGVQLVIRCSNQEIGGPKIPEQDFGPLPCKVISSSGQLRADNPKWNESKEVPRVAAYISS